MKPGMNLINMPEILGYEDKSSRATSPAASIIGTDIRKENLAASSRLMSRVIPPVIVDPDLDIPGKIARS